MPIALNEVIAGRLDEVARILDEQGANRFRVQAYHQAAAVLRGLARPVSEIFAEEGLAGLEKLPGVGESIARSIRDILQHGKLAMLDRLRGEHDPIALLSSVPGIGKALAWKLHDDLGLESLEELEAAAHDGRLENIAGLGAKRLAGIRDGNEAQAVTTLNPRKETAMPLYEYICKKCHKKFAEVLTIKQHDTKKLQCPKCKSEDLEKVIEPFFAKTPSKTGGW